MSSLGDTHHSPNTFGSPCGSLFLWHMTIHKPVITTQNGQTDKGNGKLIPAS